MTNALQFDDVSHAYGTTEVARDISFGLEQHEIVCLLGPSGCGKTTLLRLAAGLEKLQQGRIHIDGKIAADRKTFVPPEKRHVGLMFQDFALFPHMDVMANVLFGIPGADRKRLAWIRKMMGQLGLEHLEKSYPHQMSGGEKQRVALLRALAPKPKVLFLDEPFSALDTTRRLQIREDTVHLLKDEGIAALMVTHDPEEAMFMADRILVMKGGHIIQDDSAAEVFLHPRNAFVANFFGPSNHFEATVNNGRVDTPLGNFAAPGLEDGTLADVLVRPEAVTPAQNDAQNDTGANAEVLVTHFLGRSSCMHLDVTSPADGQKHEIRARAQLHNTPDVGVKTALKIDESYVFVFGKGVA